MSVTSVETGMNWIIPIIIIGLLVLLFVLLSRRRGVAPKIVYGKWIRWTVFGYVVVLLIATGVYYVIPKPELGNENIGEDEEGNWGIASQLYDAASQGELGNEYDPFIKGKWEIDIPDDTLDLEYDQKNGEPISIFADKKEESDGVAEVQLYSSPTMVGEIDVSDKIPLVHVDTSPGKMNLINPDSTKIAFASYKKEFPITQFTGENNRKHQSIQNGDSLLYIQIPEDVQLDYSSPLDVMNVDEQ